MHFGTQRARAAGSTDDSLPEAPVTTLDSVRLEAEMKQLFICRLPAFILILAEVFQS